MSIFSFFKKETDKPEPSALEQVIEEFKSNTQAPYLEISVENRAATVFESKLGGVPYLPKGFAYPYNQNPNSDKKPLKLLAQLNFSELPRLPLFPTQGILQFYIAYEEKEDCFGVDFDDLTAQTGFRIVYHEDVIRNEALLQSPPELASGKEAYFPFEGEFALKAVLSRQPMSPSDFRFEDEFMGFYKKTITTDAAHIWDLPDSISEQIYEAFSETGHRVGGFPFFTQEDPRRYEENLRKHTILLLQVDSVGDGDHDIMWGDCGVANFFITPDALKKCDFSDVLFTWDCG